MKEQISYTFPKLNASTGKWEVVETGSGEPKTHVFADCKAGTDFVIKKALGR